MADSGYEFSTENTVFFLGAGASQEAEVPLVSEFVPEFVKHNQSSKKGQWGLKREAIKYVSKMLRQAQLSADEYANIELLLQTIQELRGRDESRLAAFYATPDPGLEKYDPILEDLEKDLFQYIRHRCHVPLTKLEYLRPLLDFAPRKASKAQAPLDIFTVNYDNAIEALCEEHDLPYTDGFGPDWGPDNFDRGNCCVRIYRIHGSISWYRTRRKRALVRIPVAPVTPVHYYTDDETSEMMLYPTFTKAEQAEPYATLLEQMRRRLSSTETKTCVVVGYSFRDEYLNELFRNAMDVNRDLLLIIVDPSDAEEIAYFRMAGEGHGSLGERLVPIGKGAGEALSGGWLQRYVGEIGRARREEEGIRDSVRQKDVSVQTSDAPVRCVRGLMQARMYWRAASLARELVGELPVNHLRRTELMFTVLPFACELAWLVPVASKLGQTESGADFANMVIGSMRYLELGVARRFGDGPQPRTQIDHKRDFPGIASPLSQSARQQVNRDSLAPVLEKVRAGWDFVGKPRGAEARNAMDAFGEAVSRFQALYDDIDAGQYDPNELRQQLIDTCARSSVISPSAIFKQFAEVLGLSLEGGLELELQTSHR